MTRATFSLAVALYLPVVGGAPTTPPAARLVAAMLEGRGYRFVPLEQAEADDAYASTDTYTGRGGITWLHRWAISSGRREALVPDEPATARFVLDAAGIASE